MDSIWPRLTLTIAFAALSASAFAQPRLDGPLPEPMSDAEFAILAEFFAYDKSASTTVRPALLCARGRCSASEDRGSHTLEKLVLEGWTGNDVPAYLALPRDSSPPYPVVVLLHGLNGSKEEFWNGEHPSNTLREALHAQGFAVLALDAPYHGERLHENGFMDPPHLVLSGQNHRLRDMSTRSVVEHRQFLDFLATRADIDMKQIGVLGFSQGAMHALYLSAVEPRVRAAVAWATPMRKNYPLLYPGHFARHLDDTDVLVLAGESDPFYTAEEARAVFSLIPSDRKELVLFSGGHRMRPPEIQKATEWLVAHLAHSGE